MKPFGLIYHVRNEKRGMSYIGATIQPLSRRWNKHVSVALRGGCDCPKLHPAIRDDGKEAGEYSPILFRTERFRVLDHNQFWLSEQPNVAGSMSWGTACTRIATWAFLQDLQSLDTILVINTHFDHISEEARQHGAVMIDSFIRQQIIRDVWCLGDFNATLSDIALQPLENQYGEARQTAELTTGPSFTFHGFTGAGKEGHIIDHIFYKSPDWMIGSYEVITRVFKGHYPSDHFPVLAVFRHR